MSDKKKGEKKPFNCYSSKKPKCSRCWNGWVARVWGVFYLEPTFGETRSAVISNFEKLEGKGSWRKHRRVGNVKNVKVRFIEAGNSVA